MNRATVFSSPAKNALSRPATAGKISASAPLFKSAVVGDCAGIMPGGFCAAANSEVTNQSDVIRRTQLHLLDMSNATFLDLRVGVHPPKACCGATSGPVSVNDFLRECEQEITTHGVRSRL